MTTFSGAGASRSNAEAPGSDELTAASKSAPVQRRRCAPAELGMTSNDRTCSQNQSRRGSPGRFVLLAMPSVNGRPCALPSSVTSTPVFRTVSRNSTPRENAAEFSHGQLELCTPLTL